MLAAANHRSLNAEVVARLEQSLAGSPNPGGIGHDATDIVLAFLHTDKGREALKGVIDELSQRPRNALAPPKDPPDERA